VSSLLELIASVMEVPPSEVTEESNSNTIAKWDSMRQLMLASMLESEYRFTLSGNDMAELGSVSGIRKILGAHEIVAQ
jgi:acyl carrier protein